MKKMIHFFEFACLALGLFFLYGCDSDKQDVGSLKDPAAENGISTNELEKPSDAELDSIIAGIEKQRLTLISVSLDGRWGFINKFGEWVINPQFDSVSEFKGEFAEAQIGGAPGKYGLVEGGKWGFIDKAGKWVVNPQFDQTRDFQEGLAAARIGARHIKDDAGFLRLEGGKWGFIDQNGAWVINPQFEEVGDFKEGLAGVLVGKIADKSGKITDIKWGIIDKTGEWVVNPPPHSCPIVAEFHEGLLGIKTGGKFVENGMEGGKCGFIDKTGAWVINPQFEEITGFQEELAGAKSADKWGFIDKTGKWVVTPQFDKVREFNDGLAAANIGGVSKKYGWIIGGKWGFIDKTGKWVVTPQFDEVREYKDGLAAANIGATADDYGLAGGKWGFIDKTGKWSINPKFDEVSDFKDQLAAVATGGELRTQSYKNKTFKALVDEKWGVIDKNGQWVVSPIFEHAPDIISGLIRGKVEGHVVFKASGELIWPEIAENETSQERGATEKQTMMGSGFYVSADGHVITNHHVVSGAKEIKIAGQRAELISQDASNDLALLKLSGQSTACAIFRKENSLKLGEDIFAYGFPLAGLLSSSGSLSSGTISALSGIANNVSQIQISVPVQPGNSGGPLLDRQGAVVGVVVGKLDERTINKLTGHLPENVNFAISAATVKAFLDANNIDYKESGFFDFNKSNEEIATAAQKITVKVESYR